MLTASFTLSAVGNSVVNLTAPYTLSNAPAGEYGLSLTVSASMVPLGTEVKAQAKTQSNAMVLFVVSNERGRLVSEQTVTADEFGEASLYLNYNIGRYFVSAVSGAGGGDEAVFNVLPMQWPEKEAGTRGLETRSVNESEAVTPFNVRVVANSYTYLPGSNITAWANVVDNYYRPIANATIEFVINLSHSTSQYGTYNTSLEDSNLSVVTDDNGNANYSFTIPADAATKYARVYASIGSALGYDGILISKALTVSASTDKGTYGLNETVAINVSVKDALEDLVSGADVSVEVRSPIYANSSVDYVPVNLSTVPDNNNTIVYYNFTLPDDVVITSGLYVYLNYTGGPGSIQAKLYDPNGTLKDTESVSVGYLEYVYASTSGYPNSLLPSGDWVVMLNATHTDNFSVVVRANVSYSQARRVLSEIPLVEYSSGYYSGTYDLGEQPVMGSYQLATLASKTGFDNGTDTDYFTVSLDTLTVTTDRIWYYWGYEYPGVYGFNDTVTVYVNLTEVKTSLPVSDANVTVVVESPAYSGSDRLSWNVSVDYNSTLGLYVGSMVTPNVSMLVEYPLLEGEYTIYANATDRGYDVDQETGSFKAFLNNATLAVNGTVYMPNDLVSIEVNVTDWKTYALVTDANVTAHVTSPNANHSLVNATIFVNNTGYTWYNFTVNDSMVSAVYVYMNYSDPLCYYVSAVLNSPEYSSVDLKTVYNNSQVYNLSETYYYHVKPGNWSIRLDPYLTYNVSDFEIRVYYRAPYHWDVPLTYSGGSYVGSANLSEGTENNVPSGTYRVNATVSDRGHNSTAAYNGGYYGDRSDAYADFTVDYLQADLVLLGKTYVSYPYYAYGYDAGDYINFTVNVTDGYGDLVDADEVNVTISDYSATFSTSDSSLNKTSTGVYFGRLQSTLKIPYNYSPYYTLYANATVSLNGYIVTDYDYFRVFAPLLDATLNQTYYRVGDSIRLNASFNKAVADTPVNATVYAKVYSNDLVTLNYSAGLQYVNTSDNSTYEFNVTDSGTHKVVVRLNFSSTYSKYVNAYLLDPDGVQRDYSNDLWGSGDQLAVLTYTALDGVPLGNWSILFDPYSSYGNVNVSVNATMQMIPRGDAVELVYDGVSYTGSLEVIENITTTGYVGLTAVYDYSENVTASEMVYILNNSAYTVQVSTDKNYYLVGENVTITANITNVLGQPVAGANVTANVSSPWYNFSSLAPHTIELVNNSHGYTYYNFTIEESGVKGITVLLNYSADSYNYVDVDLFNSSGDSVDSTMIYNTEYTDTLVYHSDADIPLESNWSVRLDPGYDAYNFTIQVIYQRYNDTAINLSEAGGGVYAGVFSETNIAGTYNVSVIASEGSVGRRIGSPLGLGTTQFTVEEGHPFDITFDWPSIAEPGVTYTRVLQVNDTRDYLPVENVTVNLVLRYILSDQYDQSSYVEVLDHLQNLSTNASGQVAVTYALPFDAPQITYRWEVKALKGSQYDTHTISFTVKAFNISGNESGGFYFGCSYGRARYWGIHCHNSFYPGDTVNLTANVTNVTSGENINISSVNVLLTDYNGVLQANVSLSRTSEGIYFGQWQIPLDVPASPNTYSYHSTYAYDTRYVGGDAYGRENNHTNTDSVYIRFYDVDVLTDWKYYAPGQNVTVYVLAKNNIEPVSGLNVSVNVSGVGVLSTDGGDLSYSHGYYVGVIQLPSDIELGSRYVYATVRTPSNSRTDSVSITVLNKTIELIPKKTYFHSEKDSIHAVAVARDFETGNPLAGHVLNYSVNCSNYSYAYSVIESGSLTTDAYGVVTVNFDTNSSIYKCKILVENGYASDSEWVYSSTYLGYSDMKKKRDLDDWVYYRDGVVQFRLEVWNESGIPYNRSSDLMLNGTVHNLSVIVPGDAETYFGLNRSVEYYFSNLTLDDFGVASENITLNGTLFDGTGYDSYYLVGAQCYKYCYEDWYTETEICAWECPYYAQISVMLMNVTFNTSKSCYNSTENVSFNLNLVYVNGTPVVGANVTLRGDYEAELSTDNGSIVDQGNGNYTGSFNLSDMGSSLVLLAIKGSDYKYSTASVTVGNCEATETSASVTVHIDAYSDYYELGDEVVFNVTTNWTNGTWFSGSVDVYRYYVTSPNGLSTDNSYIYLGTVVTNENGFGTFEYVVPTDKGAMLKGSDDPQYIGNDASMSFTAFLGTKYVYTDSDTTYIGLKKFACSVGLNQSYYSEDEALLVNLTSRNWTVNGSDTKSRTDTVMYSPHPSSYHGSSDLLGRYFLTINDSEKNVTGVEQSAADGYGVNGHYYAKSVMVTEDGYDCSAYNSFNIYRYYCNITPSSDPANMGDELTLTINVYNRNTKTLPRNVSLFIQSPYYLDLFIPQRIVEQSDGVGQTSVTVVPNFTFSEGYESDEVSVDVYVLDTEGRRGYCYGKINVTSNETTTTTTTVSTTSTSTSTTVPESTTTTTMVSTTSTTSTTLTTTTSTTTTSTTTTSTTTTTTTTLPDFRVYYIDRIYNPVVDTTYKVTGHIRSSTSYSNVNVSLNVSSGSGSETQSVLVDLTEGWDNYASFDWTPTSGGDYTLTITVDADDQVTESDEGNNQRSRSASVTAYNAKSIVRASSVGFDNTSFVVNVSVYSNGDADDVRVLLQRTTTGRAIETLVNSTFNLSTNWNYIPFSWDIGSSDEGVHTFTANVDPENAVTEGDEGDNTHSWPVEVVDPEFNITEWYPYSGSTVKNGDQFSLYMYCQANGEMDVDLVLSLPSNLQNDSQLNQTVRVGREPTNAVWTITAVRPGLAGVNVTAYYVNKNVVGNVTLNVVPRGAEMKNGSDGMIELESEQLNVSFNLTVYPVTYELLNGTICVSAGSEGSALAGLEYLWGYYHGCVEQKMSKMHPQLMMKQYYRQNGKLTQELNATLYSNISFILKSPDPDYGLEAHQEFTCASKPQDCGGWGWFYPHQATTYFTQYALYGLAAVKNDVDYGNLPNVSKIEAGAQWLIDHQSGTGCWIATGNDYVKDTSALTGLVIRSLHESRLALTNPSVLASINNSIEKAVNCLIARQNVNGSWNDQYSRVNVYPTALSILALEYSQLSWANVTEAVNNGTGWLLSQQRVDGSWTLPSGTWISYGSSAKTAATTGYALMALYYNGYSLVNESVYNGSQYITSSHTSWDSTQATAIAIHALTLIASPQNTTNNVSVFLDDELVGSTVLNITNVRKCFDVTSLIENPGTYGTRIEMNGSGVFTYDGLVSQYVDVEDVPDELQQFIDPLAEEYSIELSLSNDTVKVGENVTVDVTVVNNASEAIEFLVVTIPIPPGFTVYPPNDTAYSLAAINGTMTMYVEQIADNESWDVTYWMTPTKVSNATLKARVSPMYNEEYFAESGNQSISVLPIVDVEVKSVGVDGYCMTNTTCVVRAVVNNTGDTSEDITVQLSIDDLLVATRNVSLNASEDYTYTYNWSATAGAHTLQVSVPQVPDEVESSDNTLADSVMAYDHVLPDLQLTALNTSPSSPQAGEAVVVNATYRNSGILAATNVTVELSVNNSVEDVEVISELAVNATETVSLSWTSSSAGNYTLLVNALNDDLDTADNRGSVGAEFSTPTTTTTSTTTSTTTTTLPGAGYDVGLQDGWNLISLPLTG